MVPLGRTRRWQMERDGQFPRRRRISANRVAWLESEIIEWIRTREVGAGPTPADALKARGIGSEVPRG
jgi:predicted DNA-binding transcriptional regulator AlpA